MIMMSSGTTWSPTAAYALWVIAEIGAMATDVAEFVGAAVGFYLLLHVPLLWGAGLAAVALLPMAASEVRTRGSFRDAGQGVWVALGDAGAVARFHADGRLDGIAPVPARSVRRSSRAAVSCSRPQCAAST